MCHLVVFGEASVIRDEVRRRTVRAITSRSGRRVRTLVWTVVLSALLTASSWTAQTTPHLRRVGVIRTTPFVHTRISMHDGEGSAYVPRDHSLWLADDQSDAIFEVAPKTGKLKRVIREQVFRSRNDSAAVLLPDQTGPMTSRAWPTTRQTMFCSSSLGNAAWERFDRRSSA
jgi:hypothetical protein